MTDSEKLFVELGKKLKDSEQSQMFGKACFKIGGKAFVCFFQNEMVFKLTGNAHKEALGLEGSKLFDPSGKKRPMKEWVQVPYVHNAKWKKYAKSAMEYVSGG